MKKLFISLVMSLLLSACGFHLRGVMDAPFWLDNLTLVSNENDKPLTEMLKDQLLSYNIRLNPNPKTSNYTLIVAPAILQRQIISVGSSTNPRQYALILNISFQLLNKNGAPVKAYNKIQIYRQLTINNDRILGSSDEENILINEMKSDAVTQIINQISAK